MKRKLAIPRLTVQASERHQRKINRVQTLITSHFNLFPYISLSYRVAIFVAVFFMTPLPSGSRRGSRIRLTQLLVRGGSTFSAEVVLRPPEAVIMMITASAAGQT